MKSYRLYLFLIILSMMPLSCGDAGYEEVSNTGSASMKLLWLGQNASAPKLDTKTLRVAQTAPSGVTQVRVTFSGSDMSNVSSTFSSSSGSGTVSGIPVGSNRKVTVEGLDSSGNVTHSGSTSGITISAGQTAQCGTVTMSVVSTGVSSASCSTAAPLSANSSAVGSIAVPNEADYFQIELTSSGDLVVTSNSSIDLYGYLFNSSCTPIAVDDDSGTGLNFMIEENLSPGIYYVAVRAYDSSTTGTYTINSTFFGTSDDHGNSGTSDDHSNSCIGATTLGTNSSASGSIEEADDYDYFRIELTSSSYLVVTSNSSIDMYGYLFDSSCTQIAVDDDSGTDLNFMIEENLSPGIYYVAVRAYELRATGTYTVSTSTQ